MNYIKITKNDIANGPGVRVTLWVSGCNVHCKGCHNPQTWDFNAGKLFDKNALNELLDALDKPYIQGLTLSGGNPIDSGLEILAICKEVKEKFPNKDIWLYSGYAYEQVCESREKFKVKLTVDGKVIEDTYRVCVLTNSNSVAGFRLRKQFEHDVINLYTIKGSMINIALFFLFGERVLKFNKKVKKLQGQNIKMELINSKDNTWSNDGEKIESNVIDASISKNHLRILV